MGKSTINGPFSTAMLVYQRVYTVASIHLEVSKNGVPQKSSKVEHFGIEAMKPMVLANPILSNPHLCISIL
jgi:hypothetical protein